MNEYAEGLISGLLIAAVVVCAVAAWHEFRARARARQRAVEIARRWRESEADVMADLQRRSEAKALLVHDGGKSPNDCALCREIMRCAPGGAA